MQFDRPQSRYNRAADGTLVATSIRKAS